MNGGGNTIKPPGKMMYIDLRAWSTSVAEPHLDVVTEWKKPIEGAKSRGLYVRVQTRIPRRTLGLDFRRFRNSLFAIRCPQKR